MPEDPDPLAMLQDGLADFRDDYVQTVQKMRESVTRPLDPNAKPLTKVERQAQDARFLSDPIDVQAEQDAQSARFRLTEEKPISKRVWNRIKAAAKEADGS